MSSLIVASVGKSGRNRLPDVEVVQVLINANIGRIVPLAPLAVDGRVGPATIAAITEFQRRVLSLSKPDGRVDPGGKTLRCLAERRAPMPKAAGPFGAAGQPKGPAASWVGVALGEASWMPIAQQEIGQKELKGYARNNPRILQYIATFPELKRIIKDEAAGVSYADVDETAWCACFVNWCLIQAGKPRGPSARAKTWLTYGSALEVPVHGAITIIYKKPKTRADGRMTSSGNHIGFYVSHTADSVTLLGGNQSDQVKESTFKGYEIRGYRWPN